MPIRCKPSKGSFSSIPYLTIRSAMPVTVRQVILSRDATAVLDVFTVSQAAWSSKSFVNLLPCLAQGTLVATTPCLRQFTLAVSALTNT